MKTQMLKATETHSEKSWALVAAPEVLQTLKYLLEHLPDGSDDELGRRLEEAQDLLEAGVECALNLWLGSFTTAITRPIHEEWELPSGHLPIGAEVIYTPLGKPIYVRSWNVQGLNGCRISAQRGGCHQSIFNVVFEMLRHSAYRMDVLCLQGCWPDLLTHVQQQIEESFEMQCTGSAAEPGNQQAGASQVTCGTPCVFFCAFTGILLPQNSMM